MNGGGLISHAGCVPDSYIYIYIVSESHRHLLLLVVDKDKTRGTQLWVLCSLPGHVTRPLSPDPLSPDPDPDPQEAHRGPSAAAGAVGRVCASATADSDVLSAVKIAGYAAS